MACQTRTGWEPVLPIAFGRIYVIHRGGKTLTPRARKIGSATASSMLRIVQPHTDYRIEEEHKLKAMEKADEFFATITDLVKSLKSL